MAKFPVVKKFLCIFDLQKSIYFIAFFNIICCCFLIYFDANELIHRMEVYKKSIDLDSVNKDESDWFTLYQVTKIVVYLFAITSNILLCCGVYITKDVCCTLTFYVMSIIVAILTLFAGFYRLLPHFIAISICNIYFVISVYSLEMRIFIKIEEKKARERDFDRDRMKGF